MNNSTIKPVRLSQIVATLTVAALLALSLHTSDGLLNSASADDEASADSAENDDVDPGEFQTYDERIATVNQYLPEFGGAYFDRETGNLQVWLTDDERDSAEAARDFLAEVLDDTSLYGAEVDAKPAAYTWTSLLDWITELRSRIDLSKLDHSVVTTDIDDRANRIAVGLTDPARHEGELRRQAEAAGLPTEALIVNEATPPVPDSVRGWSSTVVGGLRVQIRPSSGSGSTCTLGVVAERNGVRGFVSNSHCTSRRGGNADSDLISQWNASNSSHEIGTETRDGQWFTSNCPSGYLCRWADATFFASTNSNRNGYRGYIAWPASTGDPDDWNGSTKRRITAAGGSVDVGKQVAKVGITTGRTQGWVQETCIDYSWTTGIDDVPGTSTGQIAFKCQNTATYNAQDGDSGSPVFRHEGGASTLNATLHGIHWGSATVNGQFVRLFSPTANLRTTSELGTSLRVCNSLSFGC